jgi:hypothetical protein
LSIFSGLCHAVNRFRNVYVTGANSEAGTGTDIITLKYSQFVGIYQTSNEIPHVHELLQNYPNPFNTTTKIKFNLPKGKNNTVVKISIYDILGREIEKLLEEPINAGYYEIVWNADKYSSGIYFYRLQTDNYIETTKMVLLK